MESVYGDLLLVLNLSCEKQSLVMRVFIRSETNRTRWASTPPRIRHGVRNAVARTLILYGVCTASLGIHGSENFMQEVGTCDPGRHS